MNGTPAKRPTRHLTWRSAVIFTAVAILIAGAWLWLRRDERYISARILNSVATLVLEESPFGADPSLVLSGAAEGMTSVLDPYSSYLSSFEYELFQEESEGEYVGIGVGVRVRSGMVIVTEVRPQSPAADVFIEPGDRLVAIDGVSLSGRDLVETAQLMRGPEGSIVSVTLEKSTGESRSIQIVRRRLDIDAFPIVGVTRSGIAYIRWSHFSDGSGDRLAALIEDLRLEEPLGLVLDLRGNPGGLLDEAVTAAGIFLPAGTTVCTLVDATGEEPIEYTTAAATSPFEGPVLVVQDELASSASEVLIGALHDAHRALTVGRRTTGKGWVQNLFPLESEGALRLSTARYKTPSGMFLGDPAAARAQYDSMLTGGEWRGVGIAPDIEITGMEPGSWERSLLAEGIFFELATSLKDNWPAADAEDSDLLLAELRRWADSLAILPESGGQLLLSQLATDSGAYPVSGEIREQLAEAVELDDEILFDRESEGLLRRLWEERLLRVADPDPGELDALFDLDPDLRAARDLIEQPDRYRTVLHGGAESESRL